MAQARTLLIGALAFALAIALFPLLGCSSNRGADAACAVTTPCGGDLVGTWTLQRSCGQSSGASCTISIDNAADRPYLSYVFRADGTFTLSGTFTGSYSSTYSKGCSEDGGATCAQLDQTLQKTIQSPDASLIGGGCQQSSEACMCTFDYKPSTIGTFSGTYQTQGVTLRLESTDASGTAVDSGDYCVRGNSLHLIKTLQPDGGSSTTGTFDTVLARQ